MLLVGGVGVYNREDVFVCSFMLLSRNPIIRKSENTYSESTKPCRKALQLTCFYTIARAECPMPVLELWLRTQRKKAGAEP